SVFSTKSCTRSTVGQLSLPSYWILRLTTTRSTICWSVSSSTGTFSAANAFFMAIIILVGSNNTSVPFRLIIFVIIILMVRLSLVKDLTVYKTERGGSRTSYPLISRHNCAQEPSHEEQDVCYQHDTIMRTFSKYGTSTTTGA